MASDRFAASSCLRVRSQGSCSSVGWPYLGDPSRCAAAEEHYSYWRDNRRGQHQISGLLLAPLIGFLLVFFGAGLQRSLRREGGDSGHGAVAFGGSVLAAGTFALVGMLEGAATNAAHEGEQQAAYIGQPASLLRLGGMERGVRGGATRDWARALRNGVLPTTLAWATIVIGASLITPLGFFGFFLLPPAGSWSGYCSARHRTASPEPMRG